ncbi:hypothetical protein [Ketobacter sp.]|uniref:hypothetical protein n=1 Tax=Ketobacter sp. TaxID=2083498 RepID=UPI0025BE3B43|nr:hypothetical protein [Ketobacter sp.]
MGHVIAIFGTLIALNLGFGYWLSEQNDVAEPEEGVVEVEEVPADPAAVPQAEDQ